MGVPFLAKTKRETKFTERQDAFQYRPIRRLDSKAIVGLFALRFNSEETLRVDDACRHLIALANIRNGIRLDWASIQLRDM